MTIVEQLPDQSNPCVKVLRRIGELPLIDDQCLEFLLITVQMHLRTPDEEKQIKHALHHLVAPMDYSVEKLKEFNKTYHL